MEVAEIFAQRARQRLDELEWTGNDLAKVLGVAASDVSRTLSGQNKLRIDRFKDWAVALKTTPSWLLGMDQEPSEQELRFACVAAVLEINVNNLPVVRNYLVKMAANGVDSTAQGKKGGSP